MEKQLNHRTVDCHPSTVDCHPTDCQEIVEWLAQGGITVELVEERPADACSVCPPVDLHVAA